MGLERRRKAVVAADSTGKWRILAATEKADHAQVEGSTAAAFPRDEPASDRPQLFGLTKHRSRLRFRRRGGWRKVAAARGLAQASGAGLDRYPPGTQDPQEPDPATDLAGKA